MCHERLSVFIILIWSSAEEADDWQNQLWDLTRSVNNKICVLRTKEKSSRIAAELSNLVVYCQAVPFDPVHVQTGSFYEMCSFVESKLDKLVEKGLVTFNIRQLSRVYPHGSRITSANYNPVPMWNASCHMVALNYQTGDRAMQLNQGKFMGNGRCGYVLKPEYMIDGSFDPQHGEMVRSSIPIRIIVQVIAGRHLSRRDKHKGICSPFVEVEIVGLPCDDRVYKTRTIDLYELGNDGDHCTNASCCSSERKNFHKIGEVDNGWVTTKPTPPTFRVWGPFLRGYQVYLRASNGLNPLWNQTFVFKVTCPEMALLRFQVEDGDFVGPKTDPFIGQAVFPLDSIRSGFRSIPLRNQFSEELELSSLLVHMQMITLGNLCPMHSAHTVLQSSRMAQVFRSKNRKLESFDSMSSSTSLPSSIAVHEQDQSFGDYLLSGNSGYSPSIYSSATRKLSRFQSQDGCNNVSIVIGAGKDKYSLFWVN
ncbi:Phosphatidylinositol-specific phospholipase C, Y domain protein [Dictyocaulus viviparus]|uniref:Phosphoinositide phospholipase C n=1 Tax=Dictyocaulus viviparus TaxID=29172 RepID=A0A0D8XJ79_DICVI|nr:Phosphatidylinositol-specific phospholipase C, Y domain protein [Dictyocaulus viviparus]